ncbi:MAG: hypothetical protein JO040_15580 [Gemmatimonadetes bacterium]|nr:hypothetical protein [Gemmatimonadota bacterium]
MRNRYFGALAAAFLLAAPALAAQTPDSTLIGVSVDNRGNVGMGTLVPTKKLDVRGDAFLSGVLSGSNWIGGGAASIKGYTTGSDAGVFALKYDSRNFGNSPTAIQIWNASTGVYKTFIIDHPLDPSKYLVHATLEGPEGSVFYRGTARLKDGRAEVVLPSYFEALTHTEGRTILLTNIDGFDRLAVRTEGGAKIVGGRFVVVSENPHSDQEFDWEVKAVRKDLPPLEVEPDRAKLDVSGFGPYRIGTPRHP